MEGYHHLTLLEREIAYGKWEARWSIRRIASEIGRSASTVMREFRRNRWSAGEYIPVKAHERAKRRVRGRPPKKIVPGTRELRYVLEGLARGWSAETIAGRWRYENPGKTLSHETVYRFIYSDESKALGGRDYITWQRTRRRRRGRRKRGAKCSIPGRVSIDERPAEAADRSQFGHYECDLVCFSRQRGAVLHIVERKTEFGVAALIPSKGADDAAAALSSILDDLQAKNPLAVISVTFDNGKEFSKHTNVAEHAHIKTFFCHPYSSWQKGTVENANGILRRYLPRKTDLSHLEQDELSDIRAEMNNRPMKVLGWLTPVEAFRKELLELSHTRPVALHP